MTTCLASTGFDLTATLLVGLGLMGLGILALRVRKARPALLVVILVLGAVALVSSDARPAAAACPAGAATSTTLTPTTVVPSPPAPTPLGLAADDLAGEINATGFIATSGSPSQADVGDTVQTVLALSATAKVPSAASTAVASAVTRADGYLATHVDDAVDGVGITPSAAHDSAGSLAYLILVAHATGDVTLGAEVTQVGGLLDRLVATQSGAEAGLFGSSDPTYDGATRQSLALLALVAAGATTSGSTSADLALQSGLSWLLAQQCSGGGFSSDVAKNPCSGLPASYQGPDSNSSAYALMALGALHQPTGALTPIAEGLGYLSSLELSNAGWDYFGGGFDASSTALAILALRAVGQDPSATSGPWARPVGGTPTSPMMALGTLEVLSAGSVQGGFLFQLSSSLPDKISTEQATLALSGAVLPL